MMDVVDTHVFINPVTLFCALQHVCPVLQARGEVAEDDVSLWGCLAKVRDHKTGTCTRILTHLLHLCAA